MTHDPGPTSQLVQNTWSRITGKSKCPGYLAQYLKFFFFAKFMVWEKKKSDESTQCTKFSICAAKQPLGYLIQDLQKTCRDHSPGLSTKKKKKKKKYTKREE